MNLSLYVDSLRQQLAIAADAGGDEARALAERLTAPLDSAARLVLLEALSAAADEITRELAPGTVEVRLRGAEPAFVVTLPPGDEVFDDLELSSRTGVGGPVETDEGGMSRLNLRLPDALKLRIDEAARMQGLSLNAWLVRAAAAALGQEGHPQRQGPSGGERYTGWVR
ncbi:MAG: type II toxin-antitoxin system HicB family antitoxin [Actinomycetota bacterium]|nr:type II toxin-antitoxin system HicB family antitoxin [Actinomycetota bacterium]